MRILISWSGGKDSALALREIVRGGEHEVAGLLTTFSEDFDRVSMHGVRREVAEAQARALGLPLIPVFVPGVKAAAPCPLTAAAPPDGPYERRMREALACARDEGVRAVASGDIFLEDVRAYREARLAELGLSGVFPLWRRDTRELSREFVEAGFRGVCVCADAKVLDRSFAGRPLDGAFFASLPKGVDPCGERGEFHSFVEDGPLFASPVHVRKGKVVHREPGFWFQELALVGSSDDAPLRPPTTHHGYGRQVDWRPWAGVEPLIAREDFQQPAAAGRKRHGQPWRRAGCRDRTLTQTGGFGSHWMAREEVLRHQPESLAAFADHDVGFEPRPGLTLMA